MNKKVIRWRWQKDRFREWKIVRFPPSIRLTILRRVTRSIEIDFSDRSITRETLSPFSPPRPNDFLLPARSNVRPVRPFETPPAFVGTSKIIIMKRRKKKKISSRVAAFLCWPYHLLRIQLREDGGDRRKKENREGGEKRECSRRLCLFSCSFSRCFVPSSGVEFVYGKNRFPHRFSSSFHRC